MILQQPPDDSRNGCTGSVSYLFQKVHARGREQILPTPSLHHADDDTIAHVAMYSFVLERIG